MSKLSTEILSDITVFNKYARYIPELKRRETWEELCLRNINMHVKKYPHLEQDIFDVYNNYVVTKKVLPSMRGMQFAGKPIELSPNRIYNCFAKETKFITVAGIKSFEDFKDGDKITVLTHTKKWKKSVVKNFGKQELQEIVFSHEGSVDHTVFATPDHRWILSDNTETTSLKVGDSVPYIAHISYELQHNTPAQTVLNKAPFIVKKITKTDRNEDVWCLEVEDDHSFVLDFGAVTGNCAALAVDDYRAFSEIMFLLLGGTGVGYSVQRSHVAKLPPIKKPTKTRRYVVADSIEGWADAVKMLISAYMKGKALPVFDFSDIRPKGALLITSGGKAPGPEPLKDCLHNIQKILDRKKDGEQLSTLEVHDIVCYIADAVLAGGIRRAALIATFNIDDQDMLTCKYGNWYELNPQRARANNSAVVVRHKVKKQDFLDLWSKIKASGSGEPGIYLSNNAEWNINPCCEISLRPPAQFCNLVEMNLSNIESQEDLNGRAKAAAFIATLQAGYTDFHYLRDIWKKTTEKDALIGVSGTGIASEAYKKCNLKEAALIVSQENERVAKLIGINKAARQTAIKPSGTTSLVLGTSSGIHAWFDKYYIRRMKLGKNEAIYKYLVKKLPELIEDDFFKPNLDAFVKIPVAAPEGAIVSPEETALQLLERIKYFSENWIKPGHFKGDNSHNVSATVYIKENEWQQVGEWMWDNRDYYNGLSVLPFDGGTYTQAPHESITKEVYEEMSKFLKEIDLSEVTEEDDNTALTGELACANGACEIK